MGIIRIDQLPEGEDNLSNDDIFVFMDNPSGSGVTKKVSLSQLGTAIGSASAFQVGNIDLHNGGVQSAQILQFNDASKQSVITGPTPAASGNTAQRLIIQGQSAQGNGEGGDVYLWGGDSDINGGDIKIYAGDADSNVSGDGGYVNIDGGSGVTNGGDIEITAGYSEGGQAGDINIIGGSTGSGIAGDVNITAGYPSGIVAINTTGGGSRWEFKSDGKVFLPMSTLDVGGDTIDIKSSNYVGLWYHSGPSGTPNNYIEVPNNNTEAYLWTTYDGTHIENYRLNDGTNPSWDYEWHFTNNGKLKLPMGGDIVDSNGTSVLGGSGSTTVVDLSYSSTINTDSSSGDIFDITLTGDATLANPTNPINGKTLRWRITQDGTGNWVITLGNKFNAPSSASSPLPWSTTPNSMDILAATYHSGRDVWDIVAFVPGY
jgi:hypothetical protein